MADMLPCPFCGEPYSSTKVKGTEFLNCTPSFGWFSWQECNVCGARGPVTDNDGALYANVEEALGDAESAWNTRPSPWRDIGSAPWDGIVDLWLGGYRMPDCEWRAPERPGVYPEQWCSFDFISESWDVLPDSPTHWMPTPEPPNTSADDPAAMEPKDA